MFGMRIKRWTDIVMKTNISDTIELNSYTANILLLTLQEQESRVPDTIKLNKIGIVGFVPNVIVGGLGAIIVCYGVYVYVIRKSVILNFIFYPAKYI